MRDKTQLDLDVSHPWEGDSPICRPNYNPDCIPTEEEMIEIFKYFQENEPDLFMSIITYVEMGDFFTEGYRHANI